MVRPSDRFFRVRGAVPSCEIFKLANKFYLSLQLHSSSDWSVTRTFTLLSKQLCFARWCACLNIHMDEEQDKTQLADKALDSSQ